MVTIKKTGHGYYLVNLDMTFETLKKSHCLALKIEISKIIKPHRDIAVDLKGVNKINSQGILVLKELKKQASNVKCNLRFINIVPALYKKIFEQLTDNVGIINN